MLGNILFYSSANMTAEEYRSSTFHIMQKGEGKIINVQYICIFDVECYNLNQQLISFSFNKIFIIWRLIENQIFYFVEIEYKCIYIFEADRRAFLNNYLYTGSRFCPKVYFNHKCFSGAFLSKGRVAELPSSVGPGPILLVLKEVKFWNKSDSYRPTCEFCWKMSDILVIHEYCINENRTIGNCKIVNKYVNIAHEWTY